MSSGHTTAAEALARGHVASLQTAEDLAVTRMLEGWSRQQASRGLRPQTIDARLSGVKRFTLYCGTYPWEWTASDLEDFTVHLLSEPRPVAISTARQHQSSIAAFCAYANDPDYGWPDVLADRWQSTVTQVLTRWNAARHLAEYEGKPTRRPLSYEELQLLFDTADARLDHIVQRQAKGALAALRDSTMLKTTYAYGLRRGEVVSLQLQDLHHNSAVPSWGRFAALHVRFGKAAGGGPPRRRTVLAVPEFSWAVEGLRYWVEDCRPNLATAEAQSSLWPTERHTAVSARYLDGRFAAIREAAGLDPSLTLHSLRHSYVTHLIEHGYSERFVQEQVGHRHASTTTIYAAVSDDYKRRAIKAALNRDSEGRSAVKEVSWHLRKIMADRGMYQTTDLGRALADQGVVMSREQVYRLVTSTPQRLNMSLLAALCEVLGCLPNDLIGIESQEVRRVAGESTNRTSLPLNPVRARVSRPRT